ncbi:DegT/DnrJ/EryC1/StrS aminotransferase [Enhygromyxa salina]|uniref:DegT/DnrJ/EryC1/StrS aminotransferase n=1 Tax=Enhygromyxa salina TaxID=215803 RepID=A0A0C2CS35_9BACT|nr:DegT/DnrJ/EryC1/StrS aminotransferase [Enhygromyxa salina]
MPLCQPPALALDLAPGAPEIRGPIAALCGELGRILARPPESIVPTACGRAALAVGLRALALADTDGRDEVVVPSFACPQVIEAVLDAGLRPVLCDLAPDRPVPDLPAFAAATGERSLAIVAASVLRAKIELEALDAWARARGICVIDDAAQAFDGRGSTDDPRGPAASRGSLGVLSFGRHKPICAGAGGALVIHDASLAPLVERARAELDARWRQTSLAGDARRRPWFTDVREALEHPPAAPARADMDPTTATRVLARLGEGHELDAARRVSAELADALPACARPRPHDPALPQLYFAVEVEPAHRHALATQLAAAGVESSWLYLPLHHSSRYRPYARGPVPEADALWPKLLLLPTRGWLTPSQRRRVVGALASLSIPGPATREAQP